MREKTARLLAELAARRLREAGARAAWIAGEAAKRRAEAKRADMRACEAIATAGRMPASLLAPFAALAEGARRRRSRLLAEEAALQEQLAPVLEEVRALRAEEHRWREIATRIHRREVRERERRTERIVADLAALRAVLSQRRS